MAINSLSLLDRWRNKSGAQARPLQASLELTYQCNERCTHCYLETYNDDPKRKLTLDQWKHCMHELRDAGTMYLILMGGEAMINPNFWELAEYGSKLGFHLSMITNCQKIKDQETAQRLKDVGFSNITVSLYSLDPKIHDMMTAVPGSLKRTLTAIEYMKAAGLIVGINCLLTKNNITGFFELAQWCVDNDFQIKADPMITPKFGGDLTPTRLRATPEQIRWYFETMADKWPNGLSRPVFENEEDLMCNAGKGKCAVTPYGELLTCIEVRESLGLLTEKSFSELWNGPIAQKWRNFKVGQMKDRPCDGSESFCDHCPGMAVHENRDPFQVSSYSTMLAKIKKEVFEKNSYRL